MSCTICRDPKRHEIDQALAAGSATLADLSREHGLSTSSLQRHKAHLQVKMQQARKQLQNNLFHSFYFWLTQALEMTMETAQAAQAEGNFKLLLQAVSQGSRLINIMLKHDFPLDDQMVYAIVNSSQWTEQSGLLPHDPNIMAKIRQSMPALFSAPCPPEAPPSSASPPSGVTIRAASRPVPAISSSPPAKAANGKRQNENRPSKWEKSGKFPGKECYIFDKEEEYRLLELEKKVAQLDFNTLLGGLSPAAALAKEEAILEELWNAIPIPKDKPLSEYLHEQSLKENQAAVNLS
jgi:hypothetical protein